MSAFFLALAGALFTGYVALTFGLSIIRALSLSLTKLEELTFAFFTGSAALSLLIFGLTAAHLAYEAIFIAAGLTIIAVYFIRFRTRPTPYVEGEPLPKYWLGFALVLCFPFFLFYFANALGPEYSADGLAYHLLFVSQYSWKHHFPLNTNNMYASFPEGLEMLFLVAFSIGKHSAAAATHLLFMLATATTFVAFGSRFHLAKAGIGAMVLFFLVPVAGFDASTAYNDIALAGSCLIIFYTLQLWDGCEQKDRLLLLAGIAAGFAGTIKYTGFIAPIYALGFVLWKGRLRWPVVKRTAVLILVPAALLISPWLIKNSIEVHNPVSPFANRLFPNQYVHISFEEIYRYEQAHTNGLTWSEIPLEMTFYGGKSSGILGPVFLLAPLALFALGFPLGRRILCGFLVFALPFPGNLSTRFLLPCLPFLCLALSMVFSSWYASLAPILLLHAIVCWPPFVRQYHHYSQIVHDMKWVEVFRIRPESESLEANAPGYAMARFIGANLPENTRIFELCGMPRSYVRQSLDGFYEAAENEKVFHMLLIAAGYPNISPMMRRTFQFAPTQLSGLRIEQHASADLIPWKITEIHLFSHGVEQPLPAQARLSSNSWRQEFDLVFDHSPFTIWSSWEHLKPGMFFDIDLKSPQTLDTIAVDAPPDDGPVQLTLSGRDASGWPLNLAGSSTIDRVPYPPDWKKRLMAQMKAEGYPYFVIVKDQMRALPFDSFHDEPESWGIKLVYESGGYTLFKIE